MRRVPDASLQRVAAALVLAMLASFIAATAAFADKNYGPGVTDAEIKIGQTMIYSGPASVYGQIGRAQQAYFAKINAEGGINGRKIKLISLDDGGVPAKTLEQVRRLVEQDRVLLIFNPVGDAAAIVARGYLNRKKVPQLFVGGGGGAWGDYQHYPWTIGWGSPYQAEAGLYAKHILANHPDAKIAILSENDEFGRDYVKGFKAALGDLAGKMIVGEQTYELSDPTVDSQIVTLKASGADVFFGAVAGKAASQAFRKIHDLGWRPQGYIAVAAASPEGILRPAGFETAVGFITAYYAKTPEFRAFRQDPAMEDYFSWAKKWFPDGNAEDGIVAYGYQVAQALEYVLGHCGDDLTRENVMRVATHLDHVALPMLLPGITATTSPTDYFPLKQFQMFRFTGEQWLPIGPIIGE
jgi:branched-chain amino acid transport system substrate-binding protein